MSGRRRIKGDMRERLGSLSAALRGFIRNPNPFDDPYGCAASTALIVLVAVVILGGMYITGVIDHDFTQTPQEHAPTGRNRLPATQVRHRLRSRLHRAVLWRRTRLPWARLSTR